MRRRPSLPARCGVIVTRSRPRHRVWLPTVALLAAGVASLGQAPATPLPSNPHHLRCPPDVLRSLVVTLRSQPRPAAHAGHPRAFNRALRQVAQRPLPAGLAQAGQVVDRLWLLNAVTMRVCPGEIDRLRRHSEVATVEPDMRIHVVERTALADDPPAPAPFAKGDWGLASIFAPSVWRDYGIDGTGVRVGSIDSGIDARHPELVGKASAWRDFVNNRPAPYDDNGHGTHTIATMIGGRVDGLPIGVAPGARAIVAKALDANGQTTLSTLIAAAQWIADPDGDPNTDDAPAVVNASWGGLGVDRNGSLRMVIRRWRQLGIVPVFSAGNDGPDAASVVIPAAYPEALSVGAVDAADAVAPFSSRGPESAALSLPEELGPLTPAATKPDLVAPGVAVRSARADGGYVSFSGTSMAAPHVSGVVALVRQAVPGLSPGAVISLLRRTARDLGPVGPDRMAGAGLVDARAAVRALLGAVPARPGLRLVATPPALTNQPRPGFAVDSGGAPVQVRLDGGPPSAPVAGPIVRVPIATPGRHTVEFEAIGSNGAAIGAAIRRTIDIDRSPPRLQLDVRRAALLEIAYRARTVGAGEGVAGSLRLRTSDGDTMENAEGRHVFTAHGPYWIELVAQDRAGNIARIRRTARWPIALAARRITWNRAFLSLGLAYRLVRFHRSDSGSYRASDYLVQLCAGNLPFDRFAPLARQDAHPPRGVVGIWSTGPRVTLVVEYGRRRYVLTDIAGRARRASQPLRRVSRDAGPRAPRLHLAGAESST